MDSAPETAQQGREVPAAPETVLAVAIPNPLAAWEPQARAFLLASKAANTLRAYRADWNHFTAWCAAHEQASLPAVPETVAYYLTALAGSHKPATLVRRRIRRKPAPDGQVLLPFTCLSTKLRNS